MQTLCIHNASQVGVIGLYNETECISSVEITTRMEEADFTSVIEEVLQLAKCDYHDITHLACINGPGGFTSLRMSVTAINVLHVLLKKPVMAMHLANVYKARLMAGANGVWLHSTKRDLLFIQGLGDLEQLWPIPTLLTFADCQAQLPAGTQWCGELIPEHADGLQLAEPLALTALNKALPGLLAQQPYEQQIIEPWYGREG